MLRLIGTRPAATTRSPTPLLLLEIVLIMAFGELGVVRVVVLNAKEVTEYVCSADQRPRKRFYVQNAVI